MIQPHVEHVSPSPGMGGVPVNGVISFGTVPAFGSFDPYVTLAVSGSGANVAGALMAGPAESWMFVPDNDLASSQSYTATIALGTASTTSFTFTTGTGSDVTDPLLSAAPMVTLGEYVAPVRTSDCQLPGYWNVVVDWEDAVDAGPLLYALQVQIIDLIDPGFAAPPIALTSTGSQRVLAVPELSELTVSVFAVDQAGRQAHTLSAVYDTPQAPIGGGGGGCGCDLDPQSRSNAAWSGIVLAVGLLLLTQRALTRLLR